MIEFICCGFHIANERYLSMDLLPTRETGKLLLEYEYLSFVNFMKIKFLMLEQHATMVNILYSN